MCGPPAEVSRGLLVHSRLEVVTGVGGDDACDGVFLAFATLLGMDLSSDDATADTVAHLRAAAQAQMTTDGRRLYAKYPGHGTLKSRSTDTAHTKYVGRLRLKQCCGSLDTLLALHRAHPEMERLVVYKFDAGRNKINTPNHPPKRMCRTPQCVGHVPAAVGCFSDPLRARTTGDCNFILWGSAGPKSADSFYVLRPALPDQPLPLRRLASQLSPRPSRGKSRPSPGRPPGKQRRHPGRVAMTCAGD